jgi:hypothetical protein
MNPDGHFFDPATMKAFGDTMSNFTVTSVIINDVGYWVLSRKRAIAKSFRKAGAGYWFRKMDMKIFTDIPVPTYK